MPRQTNKMLVCQLILNALPFGMSLLILFSAPSAKSQPPADTATAPPRIFAVQGVVLSVNRDVRQIVIQHEAISNYMAAMTMPFTTKNPGELAGLERGDSLTYQLHVTATESWVDHLAKNGTMALPPPAPAMAPAMHPLRDYHFTNELGQPVSLNDFRGQAVAITFIYTRCPLPEFCPRLSKNFQMVAQKLDSLPDAPKNWHLLSVSLDPRFDSPPMLKAYGESYHYNPAQWSFLTGPADKIGELARQSGVSYESDGATINHNFRTLIVDASGQLQTLFPVSGDLSDAIVSEIIKAAAVTNHPASTNNQPR